MSHTIEAIIGIAGLITYFIYYLYNAKINSKILQAERILINNEKLDSTIINPIIRAERIAIRAIAKQKHISPEQLAHWIESRLIR